MYTLPLFGRDRLCANDTSSAKIVNSIIRMLSKRQDFNIGMLHPLRIIKEIGVVQLGQFPAKIQTFGWRFQPLSSR